MRDIRKTLISCGLQDLGSEGNRYTWCNNRTIPNIVREMLDRACATNSWLDRFRESWVENFEALHSDHSPIFLNSRQKNQATQRKMCKPRRFESLWVKYTNCERIIERSWNEALSDRVGEQTCDNIEKCRIGLLSWSKAKFGNLRKEIADSESRLKKIRKGVLTNRQKTEEEQIK
ncbi:UNVERIFIED_CONTAM: hypothetical protein Slati_3412800 [Sesamum latifolium]|uniref:Reverse transcriptase n=1 Tax=Sesamum latifolium TaxID=2727402 RepID=A0AAW2UEU8_9LAMI